MALHRSALGALIGVVLSSCSTTTAAAKPPDVIYESEFNRTTYCVNGGLPMEVQFVLPDNPPKLEGENFGIREVDSVVSRIDARIATLLKNAGLRAWKITVADHRADWSANFASRLEAELAGEIAAQAPRELQLEFCGSEEAVGSAVLASLAGYFSRAVQLDQAQQPHWLKSLGPAAAAKGNSIVMSAVALRLAKIEFDPKTLAQAFAK